MFRQYRQFGGNSFLFMMICCLFLSTSYAIIAQTTPKEKPKPKKFGSSLKKIGKKEKKTSQDKQPKSDASDDEIIQVKTELVINEVLVVDRKGNAVLDLQQNDFIVSEDGASQKIEVFTFGEKTSIPRSIVLIIDYSMSQLPYMKNSIEAAKVLVDKLPPQDKMAIVTDDVELLANFTQDKKILKKKLDSLYEKIGEKKIGRSEQYTSLLAVINEMFDEEDIRPIVILQSDGDELFALKQSKESLKLPPIDSSRLFGIVQKDYSYDDIYSIIDKSRATIYSIVPGFRFMGRSQEEQIGLAKVMKERWVTAYFQMTAKQSRPVTIPMKEIIDDASMNLQFQSALFNIARLSGGYLEYLENPEDSEKIYSAIFEAMNNRYLIGYYPANQAQDGKKRTIKIEVRGHPEYIVAGRSSYYVPEAEK